MNTIDIVIPTMWREPKFLEFLKSYCDSEHINKIILVDNDKSKRPKSDLLNHKKIENVSYGKNIYVNPAWNEGYYRSKSDILCILNDDINVHEDIFTYIQNLDFTNIDIIGVHLKGSVDNFHIVDHTDKKEEIIKLNVNKKQPIGGQAYAFGVCMFVKRSSYHVIPSLYQIWYGDDYLIQKCENIYALKTSKIKGEISKTIVNLTKNKNSEVQKRIDLDTINAYKYNHFENVKNWDIVKTKVVEKNMNKDILSEEYLKAKITPSDINQNLPLLYELAKQCNHVTEMGVRTGVSTRAFLNTNVELISYDIELNSDVVALFGVAKGLGKRVQYIKADVLDIEIQETDLLFIDTLHIYEQLKQELKLHANKAKKYIAFHDTYTYGLRGEIGNDNKGLLSAIIEFLIDNPQWKFKTHQTNNNGLTILERTI